MNKALFHVAGALALVSAGEAQAAGAAQCLTRAEVHGMVGYFLPMALDSASKTCAQQLPGNSFMRTSAPRVIAELNIGRDAAWPNARKAFNKLGGEGEEFGKMSDDLVKPMFDGMIDGLIGQEIKPRNCKDIDRIMTPLAAMPAASMVDLITEVFVVAMRNDKEMPTCPDA